MELITDLEQLEKIDSTKETLTKNNETLLEMIDEFEFSNSSEEKIIHEIKYPSREEFFGNKLDENSQRVFYKITEADKKNLIEEIQAINKHYFDYNHRSKTEEDKEALWKNGCYTKIIDMNNDAVRAIVESSKYLVVSRNPIDILMCSTNQNFGSCYSMTSTYGYALGVPALIPNKDIFVCYLTKGKHQNFSIHSKNKDIDYDFRFMKMLLRFFVYHCVEEKPTEIQAQYSPGEYIETIKTEEKDILGLGYIYPKDGGKNFNHDDIRWRFLAEMFEKLGIKTTRPTMIETKFEQTTSGKKVPEYDNRFSYSYQGSWKLKNKDWFLATERTKNEYMNPYFDNISPTSTAKFDNYNGSCSNYTALSSSNTSPVDKIEKGLSMEDILSGDDCCEDNDDCRTCECCGDSDYYDDMYWIEAIDGYVCETCYNEYYFRCDCCDERYHNDDKVVIYEIDSRGNKNTYATVCQSCAERKYYFCEDCDEYYTYESMESTSEGMVCKECFDENFAECQGCGEAYRIGDMTEMLNEGYRCEDCYQGKAVTVKKFQNMNVIEFKLPWSSYFEIMEKFVNNKKASILDGLKLYNDIGTSEYDAKDTKTIVFIHGEKTNTVMHIEWE